jgi:hypothetical protein
MKRKWFSNWISILGVSVVGVCLLTLSNCARDQKLVGISIQPSSFTFLTQDSTLTANFTAYGSYIHPSANKDITSQVTWSADVSSLITVTGGAVTSNNSGCGVINISASTTEGTESGGTAVGYATVTVDNPLVSYCPGGSSAPILSVIPESTTSTGNTVSSNPVGINCPAQTCGAPFAAGTSVTLTADPSTNFVSWGTSCPGATANVCVVTVTANTSVTAIFK